ncbi:MAG TPA: DUF4340 domain-containing protein [Anaerolineales bacterium]
MVRRSTWLALILLAALVGFTVYMRQTKARTAETAATPTAESAPLFAAETGQVNSIKIDAGSGGSFALIRNGSDWLIKQPVEAKADPGQAEAAATQAIALRVLSTVDLAPADVGLDHPAYTFTFGFTDGEHHLLVGDQTPTGSGYYARLDDGKVVIVSSDGIQGLLNLLTTPPYAETPTPSPVPATETTVPTAGSAPEGTPGTPVP